MNNDAEPTVTYPELASEEIQALIQAFSQIGKCACAVLEPQSHMPVFAAGWKQDWEEFTSILPHLPERFFTALAKLNWQDIAKRPSLKFESNGHVVHCLAPVYVQDELRCFLYIGYILVSKPHFQEFAAIAEERRYSIDRFMMAIKELSVISEAAFLNSVSNIVSQLRALLSAESGSREHSVPVPDAQPEPVSHPPAPPVQPTANLAELPLELALHADVVRSLTRDIRTSLNGNIGVTGLLMRYRNEEIADLLDTMHKGNDTLLTLLDNLHDYHDILTGNLTIQRAPLDMRLAIERTVEHVTKRLKDVGLQMNIRLAPDIPPFLLTDVQRLQQVLRNVITTVARYSIGGKLFLAIKKGQSKGNSLELHILVQNVTENTPQGGGESQEETNLPVYDSADIGMLVSMELVRLLGGKMKIHTGDNAHIVFSFIVESIPLDKARFDMAASDILKRQNISIVHPDLMERQALSLQCSYWGMKPQMFEAAEQAFSWLNKSEPIDVLLIADSAGNPADFVARLKASRTFASLPVLLFTERTETEKSSLPVSDWAGLKSALEKCMTKTKAASSANQHESLAEQYPSKIMVVEDDAMNRQLIEKVLRKLGFAPVLAKNGIEAVKEYSQNHYDLIFMDLQMPGMDGITAARTILGDNVHGVQPKICALTANASQADKESVFQAGMVDFLSKPILLPKLQDAIIKWGIKRETPDEPETPDVPSNEELVDEDVIMQTKELDQFSDESILDRLIQSFLKEAPPIITDIETAFAANQSFKISKATAALAGMSRNLGLRDFAAIAKKIELRHSKGDVAEMSESIKELRDSFHNTSARLVKYLSSGR